ncbi:MAG TPA: M42 family metallopeptidase [Longimicrobiales bacterium]|nr:M42 family metallopeptidase [Longimicrobiales bacterium]
MESGSFDFLKRLLNTPAPSGFETAAARVWREEARTFADSVEGDVSGNSIAVLEGSGSPRIMLAGHIDEIGVMVTHIDDDGYIYFDGIGGWDPQVLVGQRIRLLTKQGDIIGVIGKKPVHLMKGDEKEKVSKICDLWIDIGVRKGESIKERGVRVGDPGVVEAPFVDFGNGLIASRSIDNRIGAYVVLEALRLLSKEPANAYVAAVATTQEEIGFYSGGGASTSAYKLEPDVALVIDVTFSTDAPGVEKKEVGEHKLGGGPVLTRGSASHALVFERLAEVAERENIPFTITAAPKWTSTDADGIYMSRAGVATAVISVPNRYMHSPNEMVDVKDLEATARLIAAFCRDLKQSGDFVHK